MTKKTSTPVKPPFSEVGNAWKQTTDITAMALKPSISGRYLGCKRWIDGSVIKVLNEACPRSSNQFTTHQVKKQFAAAKRKVRCRLPISTSIDLKTEQDRKYCA